MHRRRDESLFDQYAGEKAGAIIVSVLAILFLAGVALIISGISS